MPSCSFWKCKNNSRNTNVEKGVSFLTFPRDPKIKKKWTKVIQFERRDDEWLPSIYSRVCSDHFKKKDFYTTKSGRSRLKSTAIPALQTAPRPWQAKAQPSPATDPEELEIKYEPEEWQVSIAETEIKNETEPSISTLQVPNSLITGPLAVRTDTDYKTMFFKLQEVVEILKTQNQSLLLENQSLTRQLVELRNNVEKSADVKSLQGDIISGFAENKQKLNEQILEYTEQMRTITERYEGVFTQMSEEQPVQIQKTDYLQSAFNDPKCCTMPEHKNVMAKVHTLSMELNQMMAENKVLQKNLKMQRRRCERLKMISSAKSENMKKLKLGYLKLKSIYVKLKMLKRLQ